MDVPFYPNTTGDGNRCFQVSMQSAIKYYLDKEVSVEELDRLTGRTIGHQTWTPQIIPVLYDLGLKVRYYTKTNPELYLGGEPFIRKQYGADADYVLKLTDINVLMDSVKRMMEHDIFEIKVLDMEEIRSHLRENHLPLILVDWGKIIDAESSQYHGHVGALTGFDKDNFYFHDSGPIKPTPNMRIPNDKLQKAWNSAGTDNDIVIVYGRR